MQAGLAGATCHGERKYLACCVRLSPEKSPHFFVEVVERIAPSLAAMGVTPLLMGSAAAPEYAAELKVRGGQVLG